MGLAEEQETGIGGDAKGVLPQPEMADELTLHRVFRSIARNGHLSDGILLQVKRHRSKSLNGSGFQGIHGIGRPWIFGAWRKNLQ